MAARPPSRTLDTSTAKTHLASSASSELAAWFSLATSIRRRFRDSSAPRLKTPVPPATVKALTARAGRSGESTSPVTNLNEGPERTVFSPFRGGLRIMLEAKPAISMPQQSTFAVLSNSAA